MMTNGSEKPYYLYLHVPFCRSVCGYCDFCHTVYREEAADRWLAAVEKEITEKKIRKDLLTVYIGGGTPTALNDGQLDRLLTLIDPYSQSCIEYTAEINPETLTDEKAVILRRHGVNRASVGMQTGDEHLLRLLGRRHTMADTVRPVEILRNHGIDNISLDLMYSLPQQTMDTFCSSLEEAVRLNPSHLSLYSLTIEENTVFHRKGYEHLDDDTEADMYEAAVRILAEHGYHQYETANFCLPQKESVHNSAYWNYLDFYGISCGASGKENHRRYDHTRSLRQYIEDPSAVEYTDLSPDDEKFEMIMMGLRLKRGMDLNLYKERFGEPAEARFGRALTKMKEQKMLEEHDGYLRATDRGFEILNEILVEFLDG